MIAVHRGDDPARLLDRLRAGDPLALARAITAIENATPGGVDIGLAVRDAGAACPTLGVTGAPGAGKSSLVSALIDLLLARYPRIGVLTVDPSSPLTGGAVLGDRVRMAAHSRNPAVFIRSLAARGHLGGVTRTTRAVIDVLAAAGVDLVIVETVGTGQSEVEVAAMTRVRLVVCPPGLGDDMQAIKAGVLEIADLLVVNKADLPDAARTAADLRAMLHHRGVAETRRVMLASATTGEGLASLADAIEDRLAEALSVVATADDRGGGGGDTLAADAADLVGVFVRHSDDPRLAELRGAIGDGRTTPRDGAVAAVRLFLNGQTQG